MDFFLCPWVQKPILKCDGIWKWPMDNGGEHIFHLLLFSPFPRWNMMKYVGRLMENTFTLRSLTLTKLAGNHPSSSSICPHHQSLLEASRTLMTSPALNANSRSAMVTWSHTASALTIEPPLINWRWEKKGPFEFTAFLSTASALLIKFTPVPARGGGRNNTSKSYKAMNILHAFLTHSYEREGCWSWNCSIILKTAVMGFKCVCVGAGGCTL